MKLDPESLNFLGRLQSRWLSEADRKHGTFNRRMIAATIDSFIITLTIAPLVDYLMIGYYTQPTTTFEVTTPSENIGIISALRNFFAQMQATGQWDYFITSLKWQLYGMAIYATICWHYWSATPGKILCGLKIVDGKTGGPIGNWQSVIRILGYALSAMPFGIGFFWIWKDKKRRGFHDLIAGTMVIRTKIPITSKPEVDHLSDSPAP